MSHTIENARELMEKGWNAREDLRFDQAEELLNQAKEIFTELEDWYNVTECLNHLSYNEKLRSAHILDSGVSDVKQAYSISKKHGTKDQSVLRAFISLLSAQGNYEEALKYARKLFEQLTKPANKADILTHIALFELRSGHLDKAQNSLDLAEKLLEEGWESERDPQRSIWKTSLLLTKALVMFNSDKKAVAKSLAMQALDLAKQKDLKTRITQAQNFLAVFDD